MIFGIALLNLFLQSVRSQPTREGLLGFQCDCSSDCGEARLLPRGCQAEFRHFFEIGGAPVRVLPIYWILDCCDQSPELIRVPDRALGASSWPRRSARAKAPAVSARRTWRWRLPS